MLWDPWHYFNTSTLTYEDSYTQIESTSTNNKIDKGPNYIPRAPVNIYFMFRDILRFKSARVTHRLMAHERLR